MNIFQKFLSGSEENSINNIWDLAFYVLGVYEVKDEKETVWSPVDVHHLKDRLKI